MFGRDKKGGMTKKEYEAQKRAQPVDNRRMTYDEWNKRWEMIMAGKHPDTLLSKDEFLAIKAQEMKGARLRSFMEGLNKLGQRASQNVENIRPFEDNQQ